MTDTTAGRVPVVGWMGISKAIIIPANTNTDLAEFFKTAPGAFYHCDNATQYVNAPSWFGVTWFDVIATVHEATNYRTLYAISGSGNTAFAVISAGNFGGWKKDFTEVQKPTPADINAVNKTGDTMTGQLRINFDGESIALQPKTAGYASYILSRDSSNANQWYIGKGSVNNDDAAFNNYKGGNNSVNLKADGSVSIASTQGKPVNINSATTFGTTKKFTINPQGSSTLGAHLNFWGNVDRPTVIEFGDDTSYHFYSQRNKDGSISFKCAGIMEPSSYTNFDERYQAKGSYTPEGEAYTKAQSDARYQAKGSTPDLSGYMTTATANAKFVTATRQSADVSLTTSANATTVAPAGASMSGITLSTSGVTGGIHVLEMRHRTTQYCVNGTWLNAGKVSISAPVMVARRPREQEKITRITNLSQYSPGITDEVIEHDGQELHIESLISEEGYDWYEIQQLITGECFIAFDDDGVIWQISHDASYLTPDNLSVAGIDGTPDGCDIDGSWKYDGTTVYQDADIVAARVLAENDGMRNALVMQAATSIIVIQAGISCNRSLDGDTEALSAWQGYLCDLREMTEEELQQADVVFPEMPSPVF
ncbi:tail fiber assembly protein [Enterobacter ludwigii]|uniref:tail fiber assembly protein n=1 Tax=Enterobacter ludwigii TaxID=299767 RepID=UPI003BEEEB75